MKSKILNRITKTAKTSTYILLGITLIFSPLFFASTSEPYRSISFLFISLIGIFTSINLLIQKDRIKLNFLSNQIKKLRLLILTYILILIWILIQIFTNISLIPTQSLNKFFELACYGILLISSVTIMADSKLHKSTKHVPNTITKIIAITSSVFGIYGLVIYLGKIDKILWLDKASYIDSLTGTFINRNSFATYLSIGIILHLLLLLKKHNSSEKNTSKKINNKNIYSKVTKIELFFNEFFSAKIIYLIGIIINFTALLLTYSRWGLTTFLFGLVTFITLFLNSKKQAQSKKQNKLLIPLIVLSATGIIILLYVLLLGLNSDWTHKFSLINYHIDHRLGIYQATFEAIKNSPLLGHGAGTFEFIFEKFRVSTLPLNFNQRIVYAHNGYLQTVAELGLIGAMLLFSCFVYLLNLLIKGLKTRKKEHIYLISGISISIILMTNSILDFSIQIPAITITFLVLMGIFYNYTYSSKESQKILQKFNKTAASINSDRITANKKHSVILLYALSLVILVISTTSLIYYSKNIIFHSQTKSHNYIIYKIRANETVSIKNLQSFIKNREDIAKKLNKNSYHYLQMQNELSIAKFILLKIGEYWLGTIETNKLLNSAIYNTQEELRLNPLNSYSYMRLTELYLKKKSINNSIQSLKDSLRASQYTPNLMFWRAKFIIDNQKILPLERNTILEKEICKIAENNTYDFINFYKNNYVFSHENLEVNKKVCNTLKNRCSLKKEYQKILYKICK